MAVRPEQLAGCPVRMDERRVLELAVAARDRRIAELEAELAEQRETIDALATELSAAIERAETFGAYGRR